MMHPEEKRRQQIKTVAQAREVLKEKQQALAKIDVELQVTDAKHARSEGVVSFCREHLIKGGTWEELRRKLGLGPAWQDSRWRMVRATVVDCLLPSTEEEALKASQQERSFLVSKLEEFVSEIENRMQHMRGGKDEHQYWKLKLEALKLQLEEATKTFDNYVNMKKVKTLDSKTQGVSIIVQNNYHMARPGETKRDALDVTKKVTNLALKAGANEGSGSNK
jgi:hypothetical protein